MEYIKITKVDDIKLHRRGLCVNGTLHLTTHHLIFTLPPQLDSQQRPVGARELWCCYPMIEKVEFNKGSLELFLEETDITSTGDLLQGANLRIKCRDFTFLAFAFQDIKQCHDVFDSIMKLTCINDISKLYAFNYTPVRIEQDFNSWNDYQQITEFERQGLNLSEDGIDSSYPGSDNWRLSTLNKDYRLCRTYPSKLIVPKSISDTILSHSVKFRSKNRFPTLSYFYRKNGCSIIRCSQPMVGIKQSRSFQDEKLLTEVFKTNGGDGRTNLIVDARPLTNAMAQAALGAGTEIIDNYEGCKRVFLNIENIHVMRESLNKIKEVLKNGDISNQLYNRELLVKSNWLDHVSNMLRATDLLVKSIHLNNMHLVIHCSDGWDRTSQMSSLVQLCLDPFYRTVEGFCILVEKDWCSFGHKFNERSGHLQRETKFYNYTSDSNFQMIKQLNQQFKNHQNTKLESPIFQQFLDCIYQLMRQFPDKFQYNERFLRRLVYHLYSCQYGTFLYDCEKEKRDLQLEVKTRSVWDYFKSRKQEFTNPDYVEYTDVLYPNYSNVKFWFQLYGKSDQELNGFLDIQRQREVLKKKKEEASASVSISSEEVKSLDGDKGNEYALNGFGNGSDYKSNATELAEGYEDETEPEPAGDAHSIPSSDEEDEQEEEDDDDDDDDDVGDDNGELEIGNDKSYDRKDNESNCDPLGNMNVVSRSLEQMEIQ
ncbi:hypothetical protein CANARDRAFT_28459 [[Candida] arabinofermentans NRRL YB-2248]|uniref:Myotubularin phosphatase domain-containing protein n=1 Tax=[Candida] arabinofermentans NRRL YB-2248 TaxID=983967 RepID=A0A1E4T0C7_9ASCO|nr:hypothetical protein CANARDRAFT_28459 [[Candida] arabinofermentans NRRL YB-2248]